MAKYNIRILIENTLKQVNGDEKARKKLKSRLSKLLIEAQDQDILERNGPIEMIEVPDWYRLTKEFKIGEGNE